MSVPLRTSLESLKLLHPNDYQEALLSRGSSRPCANFKW